MPSSADAGTASVGASSELWSVVADLIERRPVTLPLPLDVLRVVRRDGLALRVVEALASPVDDAESLRQKDVLVHAAREGSGRALLAASKTASLSEAARSVGVRALFYKGVPLSVQLGEGQASRPGADIDMLVAWRDVPRVAALLVQSGYSLKPRYRTVPPLLERLLECERTYSGPRPSVDLHWAVTGVGFEASFADLWARRATVTIAGTDVATLDPVDAALVSCVHGWRELWASTKWLVDVGRQLVGLRDQWPQIVRRAYECRCSVALAATVDLLGAIGVALPPVTGRPHDGDTSRAVAAVLTDDTPTPFTAGQWHEGSARTRLRGSVAERRRDRARMWALGAGRRAWRSVAPPEASP